MIDVAALKRPERATASDAAQHVVNNGRCTIRFERRFSHPVSRVWEAVVTPEGQASWYPLRIDGNVEQAGSALTYRADMPDGSELTLAGNVVSVTPQRQLSLGGTGMDGTPQQVDLTLDGVDTDTTAFSFQHEFGSDPVMEPALAAGWHLYMDQLAAHLDGDDTVVNDGHHDELTAAYRARFAADAARA